MTQKISRAVIYLCIAVAGVGFLINITAPMQGHHLWRQADTLHVAYNYCAESDVEFLRPRIGPRGDSATGVAIGEFPIWSYLLSLKCQVTGSWDEVFPKLLTWLFMGLNVWLWGLFFKRNYRELFPGWFTWSVLFSFTPLFLLYFTIPIPDVFALALIGAVGVLKNDSRKGIVALRILLFLLAFAIRPYFFPALILVFDLRWQWAVSFVLCSAFYLVWFKWWVYTSDLKQWFGTELRSPMRLLGEIPASIPEWLKQVLRDHLNFVGVVFLWLGRRADRKWWLVAIGGTALVIGLRGAHFVIHSYYLLLPALMMVFIMARGYTLTPLKWRDPILAIMAVAGCLAVQHFWQPSRYVLGRKMRADVAALTAPTDKIAVYSHETSPVWHYRALRTGWLLPLSEFKGFDHCPPGAKAAMVVAENERSFELKLCAEGAN